MTDSDQVLQFLRRAKARVEGEGTDPAPEIDSVQYTRARLEEAVQHAHGGAQVPEGARLRPLKQAVLTAVRPVTSHQVPFNEQVLAAVDGAAASLERLARTVDRQEQRSTRIQASVATTDLTIDDLVTDVRRLAGQLGEVVASVGVLEAQLEEREAAHQRELDAVRSELATVRAKQSLVFRTAREALAAQGIEVDQLTELSRELTTGFEELYEDLEDTFRGTRELVQDRLRPYVDDVASVDGRGPVIDIGCGRGEWLEVLRDAQVDGYGIDLNQVVVDRCVDRGLDVRHGDALVHLRELPEASARTITSFHVVEHLSLDTLVGLIDAALVALKPGGVLILETPNPTNLIVGAASFYLDPTHLKPLHPQFLGFLVEARGFAEVEVRYLHREEGEELTVDDLAPTGDPARSQQLVDRINWALTGPLDYAVVARKAPLPGSA